MVKKKKDMGKSRTSRKKAACSPRCPIVGIGASAGGLEAFQDFFDNMPSNSGMAFVLVPHLAPEHKSMMVELLSKHTDMTISEAKDGTIVEKNKVYIIPPNKDMELFNQRIQLLKPKIVTIRHPIDRFFTSLAREQKDRAICIILSGTGTEGTIGLKEIKEEGGLVIVQDAKTSRYDGMPRSAISTGLVDYVLPVKNMPKILLKYIKTLPAPGLDEPSTILQTPYAPLEKIFMLIRNQRGNDFSLYKKTTILRRITKRMSIHGISKMDNYVTYLRSHPTEIEKLEKELMIGVTYFFREPKSFNYLKKAIIPKLFKQKEQDASIRIWVPGCSTGEEAYSIAILFQEYMDEKNKHLNVQIFGTDIDEDAIKKARAGIFPASIKDNVSSARLKRFFTKKKQAYKVNSDIREKVVFAVHNVVKNAPFSKLDIISCRNLLIYLESKLQSYLTKLFHYALNEEGYLTVGHSE
ncbi:MAG: chemotaxis protein CheB, partial [Nanoarchaeota archaeon]